MSGTLHLTGRLAGERVALPAGDIEAVVAIGAMIPVPRAAPHVAGLAALRSKVLTVIDGCAALGLALRCPEDPEAAVLIQHEGHAYALLLDAIGELVELDGPAEPLAAPPPPPPGWARVATGIGRIDGAALLVISPAAVVAGPPLATAA